MIARSLLFLLALLPFFIPLEGIPLINRIQNSFSSEPLPNPPKIKILLVTDNNGVILEVKGKYKLYDARHMDLIGTRYLGKRKFLQASKDGLIWGEGFPDIYQIAIVPDDAKTTIIVDGVEYKGAIYAYNVGGVVNIVNEMDIEDFLSATLPSQYSSSFPSELLNAIAIVARTNTYYTSQNSKTPYWDVEAGKVGYHGATLGKKSEEVEQAIRDTKYMVLNSNADDENLVMTFAAYWRPEKGGGIVPKGEYTKITLEKGEELANRGQDAAQILETAFPKSQIELIHYSL